MKPINNMLIEIDDWFLKIDKQEISPSILFYIGEMGTGKKTKINELIKTYDYTSSHLNWLHNKNHSIIKKKNFIQDLKHIVSNRNIEFFLSGKRDIVIIHNSHIVTDKSLFDEVSALNNNSSIVFVTPVIIIVNQSFVSERLLTHMTKSCYASYHKKLDIEVITRIVYNKLHCFNIKKIKPEVQEIIDNFDGNIFSLNTKIKQFIITNTSHSNTQITKKNDKNIVLKCFEELCNPNLKWSEKYKRIKPHESLIRLLMPNHIAKGMDNEEHKTKRDKLEIALKCIGSLLNSEKIIGKNINGFTSLLQSIHPTTLIQNVTIKTMILSNCQSTSTNSNLKRILEPHSNDQYALILKFIAKSVEYEQGRSKCYDELDWNSWLYNISKSNLNELQQTHLKIFKEHSITKKMVNRFVTRLSKVIPNS